MSCVSKIDVNQIALLFVNYANLTRFFSGA